MRSFELWSKTDPLADLTFGQLPPESLSELMERVAVHRCLPRAARQVLHRSLAEALSLEEVRQRVPWPVPDEQWLDVFLGSHEQPGRRWHTTKTR